MFKTLRLLSASIFALCSLHLCIAEEPGENAIQEAISLLKTRLSEASSKEEKEKISEGIEALESQLPSTTSPLPSNDFLKSLDEKDFEEKLLAKVRYKSDTGELSLFYDFRSAKQLQDFEEAEDKTVQGRALILGGGESIKHRVKFKTMTVTGLLQINNVGGHHIVTTGKFGFGSSRLNGAYTHFFVFGGRESARTQDVLANRWTNKPQKFFLKIEEDRVSCGFGNQQLGKAITDTTLDHAGELIINGVNAPTAIGSLTISGKIDAEWAKKFLNK